MNGPQCIAIGEPIGCIVEPFEKQNHNFVIGKAQLKGVVIRTIVLGATEREQTVDNMSGSIILNNDNGVYVETAPNEFTNLVDLIKEFNEIKEIVDDLYWTVGPGLSQAKASFKNGLGEQAKQSKEEN